MTISAVAVAPLAQFNVGLVAATGLVLPLAAQIDALLAIGLGPFQADLQAQFSAALAIQATLSLQISDPLEALRALLNAIAQLQAAFAAALTLPPLNLSISAELGATVALAGALSARLGLLSIAIQLALQIKLAALQALAALQLSLSAGPVAAIAFSGETWAANGAKINTLFNGGTVDGWSIPGIVGSDPMAGGVVLATGSASAAAALSAIISV